MPDGTQPLNTDSQAYVPSAAPGARAPHIWLRQQHPGAGPATPLLSTLDLFEHQFTLLTGPRDETWRSAGRRAARNLGLPLCAYAIGPGGDFAPDAGDWAQLYDVDAAGAVLVRPDGHIAWRSRSQADDAVAVMGHALAVASGRQA